jgi:hypothetical protein
LTSSIATDRNGTTTSVSPRSSTATSKQPILSGAVQFHTVFQTEYGHGQTGVTEINDPETWSTFLSLQSPCFGPSCPPAPRVNFTTQTVLVVSPGIEGSPGYRINITSIMGSTENILVEATLTTPGQYCLWASVITFPIQVVEVPKTDLPGVLGLTTIEGPPCPYGWITAKRIISCLADSCPI